MRLLHTLLKPWLAPLLRQRAMCRVMMATLMVLAFGAWMRWNLWSCLFADITGLPCPGCGLTRATSALLRGEWAASWAFHPFAGFFLILGLLIAASAVLPRPMVESMALKIETFERISRLPAVFLLGLLCFGLLRMLGFWYQLPVGDQMGRFSKRPSHHLSVPK